MTRPARCDALHGLYFAHCNLLGFSSQAGTSAAIASCEIAGNVTATTCHGTGSWYDRYLIPGHMGVAVRCACSIVRVSCEVAGVALI
jgi:hypothetical protein